MAEMWERVTSLPAITTAWHQVLDNDLEDQQLSRSVQRFLADAEANLMEFRHALADGTYRPTDLTSVNIPKENGGMRQLQVPGVRDRIAARAILDVVNPVIDPHLGAASFAYRPGLGVREAVLEVCRLRDEHLEWVVRTDIDDCFPTLNVPLARRLFKALVDDVDLVAFVELLLARRVRTPGRTPRAVAGVPQGCALSPLLANLVLAQVDAHVENEGFSLVRYADDLCLVAATREEAVEGLRCLNTAVEEVGMSLGSDKTQLTTFTDGFCFLGEDFGPRYPPTTHADAVEAPQQRVLYIAAQGSHVRIWRGRVIVEDADDNVLLDVASSTVGRLVTFGSVGISAGFRSWALSQEIDTVLASRRGALLGVTTNPGSRDRVARLRAQLDFRDTADELATARRIVEAKVHKQLVVLRRFGRRAHRDEVEDAVTQLQQLERMLPDAHSTNEVLGLEGAAARAYFASYGQLFPEALRFDVRSRRPPRDVTNAALSFLYTVLLGECVTAVITAGLDPAIGVLHNGEGTQPQLGLDLMEEFRPYVVDQVVLSAARSGEFTADHARGDPHGGVLLTKAGREAVLTAYERRMLQTTRGALPDFSGTIRRHLYRQAHRLRHQILGAAQAWTPLSWR